MPLVNGVLVAHGNSMGLGQYLQEKTGEFSRYIPQQRFDNPLAHAIGDSGVVSCAG
jgi:hypothetical protein